MRWIHTNIDNLKTGFLITYGTTGTIVIVSFVLGVVYESYILLTSFIFGYPPALVMAFLAVIQPKWLRKK